MFWTQLEMVVGSNTAMYVNMRRTGGVTRALGAWNQGQVMVMCLLTIDHSTSSGHILTSNIDMGLSIRSIKMVVKLENRLIPRERK